MIVWVDNLIIAASNNVMLNNVKEALRCNFQMKDLCILIFETFFRYPFPFDDNCNHGSANLSRKYAGMIQHD